MMNEVVFLVVLTLASTGGSFKRDYHIMPDMETCIECVESAKLGVPSGGDAEAIVAMYCAKDKAKRQSYEDLTDIK